MVLNSIQSWAGPNARKRNGWSITTVPKPLPWLPCSSPLPPGTKGEVKLLLVCQISHSQNTSISTGRLHTWQSVGKQDRLGYWHCILCSKCVFQKHPVFLRKMCQQHTWTASAGSVGLTFAGGGRLCSTAFGTLGTAHSGCHPSLPPSPCSASSEEGGASDLDPKYTRNLYGRVCLGVNKKRSQSHSR